MGNYLRRQFSKEVRNLNKYMKKCPPSLAIRQMQIRAILAFFQFHSSQNNCHQKIKQQILARMGVGGT